MTNQKTATQKVESSCVIGHSEALTIEYQEHLERKAAMLDFQHQFSA